MTVIGQCVARALWCLTISGHASMQACNLSAQGPADKRAKQCVVGCAATQPGNFAPPVERTQKGGWTRPVTTAKLD